MSRRWVLVRGIVSEEFHWWNFIPDMRARFPRDELYTPDIIGNGKFFEQSTPLGVKPNVDGLRKQVPAQEKKILVGFSLGGMLTLEWAYAHPNEVAAVVLINSSLNNSSIFKRMRPSSFMHILRTARVRDHVQREELVLRMTTSLLPQEKIKPIAEVWGPRSLQYPLRPSNFLRQLFVAGQVKQRKDPPQVPVLILSSQNDKVVHPDCSKKIADTWKLPYMVHPEAGHDLILDDPQWVLEQVETFIQKENI
ncbi:MAG: alpha/beta fold hydrolase [Pseudobdellovibrionaceae bacterium]